jgi:hypothetical protein
MKTLINLLAVCVLACTLAGCNNNKTDGANASPGAMPECKCGPGCMKDGKCSEGCKAACCQGKTSMGAVSEQKSDGCCAGKAPSDASMGAVSEKKSCSAVCPVTGKPIN